MALTLLFINVKVNQPVNLTPFLAPLNYVSILAPAQIHPKANNRRYGLCKLKQAVNIQPEVSAASSIPIFFIGMYREGIVKVDYPAHFHFSSALLHFNTTQVYAAQQTLWSV